MNIADLKKLFQEAPEGRLKWGISEPFSWRGSYDEVAFCIEENVTKEECLERIEQALTEEFYGYKGGKYRYSEHTYVNFEIDRSSYSDGEYREEMIAQLERPENFDRDMMLVKLMLNV